MSLSLSKGDGLNVAAQAGNDDLIKSFLSDGIDVDHRDSSVLFTPLHYAALHGNLSTAKILLEAGADISLTRGGQTAAQIAHRKAQYEIATLIDSYGANVKPSKSRE
eukprot:CAMPEP_0201489190 /NCGR_PEP_ID=MMETSP0151_2-20130828/21130_1 /ASSEMBLY_ACC=CAM_ASM_000257 /TAXON_ID=200890 /ORGANISM="Paramoeba atlantica, Strain 621/1 / CCAP 1560/9" /LENGTH=106 /DNA_ID=CAMNT_0047874689 /DNA_START=116 /DNA_END=436 /DNA_ORIENTATION=+